MKKHVLPLTAVATMCAIWLASVQQPAGAAIATTRPSAPTAVVASGGVRTLTVSWKPPNSDGGSPIHYYVASAVYNGKIRCVVPAGDPTTCRMSGLRVSRRLGHREFRIRVRAVNATGTSRPAITSVEVLRD